MKRTLTYILGGALFARLVVWAGGLKDASRYLTPDSSDYIGLAQNLVETGFYGTAAHPEIFRVPGYPAFLAVLSWVIDSPALICLLQVFMGVGTIWLVWKLGQKVYGQRIGLMAASIQAVSMVSIVYNCRVLSETLFTLLFVMFLYVLVVVSECSISRERICRAAACGLLLAVMAYVRAIAIPFVVFPLVLLLWKYRVRAALVCIGMFLVGVAPWYLRNWQKVDYPHFSGIAAKNMYRYNAALLVAERDNNPYAEVQHRVSQELSKLDGQAAKARHARRRALEEISQAPGTYLWVHAKTVPTNLLPAVGSLLQTYGVEVGQSGTLAVIRSRGIVAGVQHYFRGKWGWLFLMTPLIVLLGMIYVMDLIGMTWLIWNSRLGAFEVFLLAVVAYFLLAPGGAAHPRFRVPIMPILSLFAANGLCLVGEWWTKGKN